MSAKAIREATGKDLLNRFLKGSAIKSRFAVVNENSNFEDVINQNPWLKQEVNY
jgi:ATP citrate (pro-S)-lyase